MFLFYPTDINFNLFYYLLYNLITSYYLIYPDFLRMNFVYLADNLLRNAQFGAQEFMQHCEAALLSWTSTRNESCNWRNNDP